MQFQKIYHLIRQKVTYIENINFEHSVFKIQPWTASNWLKSGKMIMTSQFSEKTNRKIGFYSPSRKKYVFVKNRRCA